MNYIRGSLRDKYKQLQLIISFLHRFGCGAEQRKILETYLRAGLFDQLDDCTSLNESINWLITAHNATSDHGVSAKYYLNRGWDVSYPETSGYILSTFYKYGEIYGHSNLMERAIRIGDWEIDIQTPTGGVLSNPQVQFTRIFNTGQVILGWCFLYEKTGQRKYLDAAIKAADYIDERQEKDGRWIKDTYCGARTYHARVDWALLRVFQLAGYEKIIKTAVRNLQWVVQQQCQTGWFDRCGFDDDLPNMHVIGYTLRGLFESHQINKTLSIPEISEMNILSRLVKTADQLCQVANLEGLLHIPGMLPASYDSNWRSQDKNACLTGNAQFACFLYRLNQVVKNNGYAETADKIMDALKRTQVTGSKLPEINGAIAGSFPIYSGYLKLAYPNWATKFFADGLIMKNQTQDNFNIPA